MARLIYLGIRIRGIKVACQQVDLFIWLFELSSDPIYGNDIDYVCKLLQVYLLWLSNTQPQEVFILWPLDHSLPHQGAILGNGPFPGSKCEH